METKQWYLDCAAATPLRPEVRMVMEDAERSSFGNPSSLHQAGRAAHALVTHARMSVARTLGARESEIIFTSGGTESNNLGVLGVLRANRARVTDPEAITTAIEHASVLAPLRAEAGSGLVVLPVKADGIVDLAAFRAALTPKTVLVSVGYANGEIGTVQPVVEIGRIIRAWRKEHNTEFPYFHIDASQAPLYLPLAVERLSCDLLTLDAGKCYGPRGMGVLYARHGVPLTPLMYGGGQEGGLRPGTEDSVRISGAAAALSLAAEERAERAERIDTLRDQFLAALTARFSEMVCNGSITDRLPNNLSITFPGYDAEYLAALLETHGILCGTKSACAEGQEHESPVLAALGTNSVHFGALRLSLCDDTDEASIPALIEALEVSLPLAKILT